MVQSKGCFEDVAALQIYIQSIPAKNGTYASQQFQQACAKKTPKSHILHS
jgi:hypothetical protein